MTNTRTKITILGMLLAAQVVAGLLFLFHFHCKNRLYFSSIAITGILWGPIWCGLSAAVGTLLLPCWALWLIFTTTTISALLSGIIYGIFSTQSCKHARILLRFNRKYTISVILQTFG